MVVGRNFVWLLNQQTFEEKQLIKMVFSARASSFFFLGQSLLVMDEFQVGD